MKESVVIWNSDAGKTPDQLLAERTKRLRDAMELKQPDRVPIQLPFGYMLAEIGGITREELHSNPVKAQELLEQAALEYQPDAYRGFPGDVRTSKTVGDRMTRWPGHGLGPNGSFQFAESEFMKAEDYDHFLEDPADWGIRVYTPRAFGELEGLAKLFPLGMTAFGYYNLMNLWAIADEQVVHALDALSQAVKSSAAHRERVAHGTSRMAELGFPPSPVAGTILEAPFDFLSDTLRGMRGIFLDMLKRPEKLLAAEEKVARFQLEFALSYARQTGTNRVFFPLHRGSDGFMSLAQFERFYWPQLKAMWLALIEHGITPVVFFEGVWDQRLSYLAELPKGKIVGWFQASDIFKVKRFVGDTMCIAGGMPNSLLNAGTVDEVREHTRKLCEVVGKNGGFIMSTPVSEMEGSKPELVKAWVEATREYGAY